ncbi:MAG: hypothetical protein JWL77_3096 [Chthonomonadaceae bacterium]|nr:hypothetical protein [Chthonomonadaceae bacterium]
MIGDPNSMRLLILSCSSCKLPDMGVLPALERYNGPAFRVVRRYLNSDNYTTPTVVYILSAEYGLIPGNYPIPWYDRRMTMDRAIELRSSVLDKLKCCLNDSPSPTIVDVYINLSSDYLATMAGFEAITYREMSVRYASGSQGQRLSSLYTWLYKEKPYTQEAPTQISQEVFLRGVPLRYSIDQVRKIANEAYTADSQQAQRFHSWYVCIDGKRLSAKWLVRQITGLSCSRFTTGEACRVLRNIGITVSRVAFGEEQKAECS